jgi:predicted RecB family endonuclease
MTEVPNVTDTAYRVVLLECEHENLEKCFRTVPAEHKADCVMIVADLGDEGARKVCRFFGLNVGEVLRLLPADDLPVAMNATNVATMVRLMEKISPEVVRDLTISIPSDMTKVLVFARKGIGLFLLQLGGKPACSGGDA